MNLKLRSDSVANRVLVTLSNAPTGMLHVSALYSLIKGRNSTSLATRIVNLCNRIISERMVIVEADMWQITPRRRLQIKNFDIKVPQTKYVGQIARPQHAREFKALKLMPEHQPYRPYSFDYALIPSLFGSIRKLPDGEVVS